MAYLSFAGFSFTIDWRRPRTSAVWSKRSIMVIPCGVPSIAHCTAASISRFPTNSRPPKKWRVGRANSGFSLQATSQIRQQDSTTAKRERSEKVLSVSFAPNLACGSSGKQPFNLPTAAIPPPFQSLLLDRPDRQYRLSEGVIDYNRGHQVPSRACAEDPFPASGVVDALVASPHGHIEEDKQDQQRSEDPDQGLGVLEG